MIDRDKSNLFGISSIEMICSIYMWACYNGKNGGIREVLGDILKDFCKNEKSEWRGDEPGRDMSVSHRHTSHNSPNKKGNTITPPAKINKRKSKSHLHSSSACACVCACLLSFSGRQASKLAS